MADYWHPLFWIVINKSRIWIWFDLVWVFVLNFGLLFTGNSDNIWVRSLLHWLIEGRMTISGVAGRGIKVSWGPVTVLFPGAYTDLDYFIGEDLLGCERKRISHLWPSVVCFYERGNGVWQCPWQCGRTEQSWYVCELGGVCVYAVTLPLIQLSKLLSDARDWQGFHSTVLDTQTHNSLCAFACMHKSSFYALFM